VFFSFKRLVFVSKSHCKITTKHTLTKWIFVMTFFRTSLNTE